MGSGTGSTLVVNPEGLSSLTMGLAGSEPYAGSTPYIVPLQTLDFNEEVRWQIVYDQAPPGEGGRAVGEYGALVPVTFEVVIKSDTRADLIEDYNDLQAALLNRKGGTIKYKPEDIGDSVLDTYYHYVQSRPPRLLARENNRWDAPARRDGKYTLEVEIEFLTQPIATSDPDSPVTLTELSTTIENWVDNNPSQSNEVTISASNLKGSLPALLRFLARPGSSQYLARLIVFRRSEGTLSNFVSVYEAEDASVIYPSSAWTSVNDSDRGDGAYRRCLPGSEANEVAQGLRFTISNPDDHEGRFAVFGVGYDGAMTTGVWTHQVKVKVGNVTQAGRDDYEAMSLRRWGLIYAGEFELPASPMSDSESAYDSGPYVEWWSSRASGWTEFRLDGIILVYVADSEHRACALDVVCDDEGGVTNSEKLLVENFLDDYGHIHEIAHVVAQSDGDFKRVCVTAPRGDFLMLDPTRDHLLVFVQEAYSDVILDDDFESYEYSRWMAVADFESDENWTVSDGTIEADTTHHAEGSQSRKLTDDTLDTSVVGTYEPSTALDIENEGRFGSGDFACLYMYLDSKTDFVSATIRLATNASNYIAAAWLAAALAAGDNFLYKKKSDFTETGTVTESEINILNVTHRTTDTAGRETSWDHWRFEKADPDNANVPNATGSQWDFQPNAGAWTITKDISGAGATLACLDTESGVEKCALIDETTPANVQFRARVMAKRDAGYAGIVWRAGDDTLTEGAEDCYAAVLDISNNKLLVREYANGSITQHDNPAFTCAIDTWYVIGVIVQGSTFKVYATAASNLDDDDDIFDDAISPDAPLQYEYLLSTVTDATLSSGKCGVISITTLGRFDEAKLESLADKVIPADDITLEGKAIWRTIAPFHE